MYVEIRMCVCASGYVSVGTNKTQTLWHVIRRWTATINKSLLLAYYYVQYVGLVWYMYGEKSCQRQNIMHFSATVNYLMQKKPHNRIFLGRCPVYKHNIRKCQENSFKISKCTLEM